MLIILEKCSEVNASASIMSHVAPCVFAYSAMAAAAELCPLPVLQDKIRIFKLAFSLVDPFTHKLFPKFKYLFETIRDITRYNMYVYAGSEDISHFIIMQCSTKVNRFAVLHVQVSSYTIGNLGEFFVSTQKTRCIDERQKGGMETCLIRHK